MHWHDIRYSFWKQSMHAYLLCPDTFNFFTNILHILAYCHFINHDLSSPVSAQYGWLTGDPRKFTTEQKNAIVEKHNHYRRMEKANYMLRMVCYTQKHIQTNTNLHTHKHTYKHTHSQLHIQTHNKKSFYWFYQLWQNLQYMCTL